MVLCNFVLCIFSRLKIDRSVIYKNGRSLNVKSMCAKVNWKWASAYWDEDPNRHWYFLLFWRYRPLKKETIFHMNTCKSPIHKDALCSFLYSFFFKLLSLYYDWPSIGKKNVIYFLERDLSSVFRKMIFAKFYRKW